MPGERPYAPSRRGARTSGLTPIPTIKLLTYLAIGGSAALLALLLERPGLAILATPFLLAVAVGLASARRTALELSLHVPNAVVEGDAIASQLRIAAPGRLARLVLRVDPPAGIASVEPRAVALRLDAGEERLLDHEMRAERWGLYAAAPVEATAVDVFGLLAQRRRFPPTARLAVYPREEALRATIAPIATQAYAGNNRSRQRGDGIEFAEAREFVPGDRPRRINWRLSGGRPQLYVNESYVERSADVVLLLDIFGDVRHGGAGTLDHVVRGAAALARSYLSRRDRVGLISIGGRMSWLVPMSGTRQLYRIVESVIGTQLLFSYAWQSIDVLPARTLPPRAQVIALSTLLDPRALRAFYDLRARGFDLTVVEVSPLLFVSATDDDVGHLAHRLWRLERAALRDDLRRAGIAVTTWDDDHPLEVGVAEAERFRRDAGLLLRA